MRARVGLAVGVAVVGGLAVGSLVYPKAQAVEKPEGERQVDLTVYSSDFALVRESRSVELAPGTNRVLVPDVSQSLDPQSVLLRWGGATRATAETIGHSFDLGASDAQALLRQEVGEAVELVRYGENGREASRERGRLLVAEAGRPTVVEVDGKVYVNPEGTLVLQRDEETPAIPQLTVEAQSPQAQRTTLKVGYLTRALSWNADYVATLSDRSDHLDLECYATVVNRTGVRYPEAKVTLVAGSPNRAVRAARDRVAARAPAAGPFAANADLNQKVEWLNGEPPEAVGDLQAYPLKNRATVRNDQLNRLLMFRRDGVKIKKQYSYQAPYLDAYSSPQQARGAVAVGLSFRNTAEEAMGTALPPGAIRVYDPDRQGQLRYAGAAHLAATPKGMRVGMTLGNAFDVTAAYRTVRTQRIGKRKVRKWVEVRVENARPQPVRVRVVQGFGGAWSVVSASERWTKLDSDTAQWRVEVPSGGKTVRFAVELVC